MAPKIMEWDEVRGRPVPLGGGNGLDSEYMRLLGEMKALSEDETIPPRERLRFRKQYLDTWDALTRRGEAQVKAAKATRKENRRAFEELLDDNFAVQDPDTGKAEIPFDIRRRAARYRGIAEKDPQMAVAYMQKEMQAEQAVTEHWDKVLPAIVKEWEAKNPGRSVSPEEVQRMNALPMPEKYQVITNYMQEKRKQQETEPAQTPAVQEEIKRREWINQAWKPQDEAVRKAAAEMEFRAPEARPDLAGGKRRYTAEEFANLPARPDLNPDESLQLYDDMMKRMKAWRGENAPWPVHAIATAAESVPFVNWINRQIYDPNAPVRRWMGAVAGEREDGGAKAGTGTASPVGAGEDPFKAMAASQVGEITQPVAKLPSTPYQQGRSPAVGALVNQSPAENRLMKDVVQPYVIDPFADLVEKVSAALSGRKGPLRGWSWDVPNPPDQFASDEEEDRYKGSLY